LQGKEQRMDIISLIVIGFLLWDIKHEVERVADKLGDINKTLKEKKSE